MVSLRRRLLEKQDAQTGRLPAEYQEVEWIESNGSQYINTEINQLDFGFEMKFISFDDISTSNFGCVLGGRYASNSSDLQLSSYTTDANYALGWRGTFRYGGSSQTYDGHLNDKGELNVIKYLNGTYTANGTDYSYSAGNISNSRYVYLFALHNNTSASQHSKIRLYYFKAYKAGLLAADYVPCYRKADNVIGMYDMVSETFKTNSGSGTFTKGGNV